MTFQPNGDLNTRETAVYRLFDASDVLLYVGVSCNPKARIPSHQNKPWWSEVAKSTVEMHPDRLTALQAEAKAIVEESPLHNKTGIDPSRVRAPRTQLGPRDRSGRTWRQAMREAGIRKGPMSPEQQLAALRIYARWKQEAGVA